MKKRFVTITILVISTIMTLLTAFALAPLQFNIATAQETVTNLDPLTIPKFVNQLTGPPPVYTPTNVTDCNGKVIRQDYCVDMDENTQQILPSMDFGTGTIETKLTSVFGYGGQAQDAVTGAPLGYVLNSPGPSFKVTKDLPSRVTWSNLITSSHPFAVDPTLHWANPNNVPMPTAPFEPFPPGYSSAQSPVPAVPHLHGGEVPPQSDGGPDAWWTNGGIQGPGFNTVSSTNSYSAVYDYPNINQESTIWYHDHALGITRLNVMSGLAGFYFVKDASSTTGAVLPTGKYDMPLAIQDRSFLTNGSFNFPSTGVQPAVHPYWIPEFFGDTIMVNGLVWPNMDVDQAAYRFRLLDGSNARFYTLSFVANPGTPSETVLPFTQIASDGGYLTAPVPLTELTFAPGERAEVLVDFSGLPAGTTVLLKNTANENFPNGAPVNPDTVGQIMQFTVGANTGPSAPTLPTPLNPTLPTFPTLTTANKNRTLTLIEILDQVTDVPLELLVDGQQWVAPAYEVVKAGDTEDWLFFNPTADSHPIHTHLTQVQLISRQPFNDTAYLADWLALNGGTLPLTAPTQNLQNLNDYFTGPAVGPSTTEEGWKDTVMMHPGEATLVRIRFAPTEAPVTGSGAPTPGVNPYPFDPTADPGYVYHCHIIDHEDNEMMRPLLVTTDQTPPTTPKTTLSCKVYDMDLAGEFKVLVNGAEVFSSQRNWRLDNEWKTLYFDITQYVTSGDNTIVLKNPTNGVCYVKNIVVTVGCNQVINDYKTYKLQNNEKCYTFCVDTTPPPTIQKTTLACKVYDMDISGEFKVLVNGAEVFCSQSNWRLDNEWKTLYFDITQYVTSGDNTIVLKNPTNGVCYVKNIVVTVGTCEEVSDYQTFRLHLNEKTLEFNI